MWGTKINPSWLLSVTDSRISKWVVLGAQSTVLDVQIYFWYVLIESNHSGIVLQWYSRSTDPPKLSIVLSVSFTPWKTNRFVIQKSDPPYSGNINKGEKLVWLQRDPTLSLATRILALLHEWSERYIFFEMLVLGAQSADLDVQICF